MYVGFCLGSISPQPFPSCNQPLNEIVQVNKRENVDFTSTVYEGNDLNSKYWDAEFLLVHTKGSTTICQIEGLGRCVSEIYPHFNMTVVKIIEKVSGLGWKRVFRFQLTIIQADYNDFGMYHKGTSIRQPPFFRYLQA